MKIPPSRIMRCLNLATVMAVLAGPAVAQGYVSPFTSGPSVPNVVVAPGYAPGYAVSPYAAPAYSGYGASPYAGGGGGLGGNGLGTNNSPYGGSYGATGPGYNGQNGINQNGGAPVASTVPANGPSQRSGDATATSTGTSATSPAANGGSSPSAAARGSLRDGDVLRGRASAVSGSSISVEGMVLYLNGVSSQSADAICSSPRSTTWKCGERAKTVLAQILSKGPVRCVFSDMAGVPSGTCTIGLEDVSRAAAVEGAAISTDMTYRAYSAEARADHRGIWAYSGR